MTKESMRKSVLVESLKDSVVPAANIDRTLEEDVELENIKSDVWETFEWGQGDPTKKGSGDKLTPREEPIKIAWVNMMLALWLSVTERIEGRPLSILSWLIWLIWELSVRQLVEIHEGIQCHDKSLKSPHFHQNWPENKKLLANAKYESDEVNVYFVCLNFPILICVVACWELKEWQITSRKTSVCKPWRNK